MRKQEVAYIASKSDRSSFDSTWFQPPRISMICCSPRIWAIQVASPEFCLRGTFVRGAFAFGTGLYSPPRETQKPDIALTQHCYHSERSLDLRGSRSLA